MKNQQKDSWFDAVKFLGRTWLHCRGDRFYTLEEISKRTGFSKGETTYLVKIRLQHWFLESPLGNGQYKRIKKGKYVKPNH
ncbi:MAG: hypothetical protein ACOZAO_04105 [Patescibacteria group bacterium]